ncbi:MAG: tRNA (adenosine(37)-N6)-threonylcarbamoyltransferase complex ATPase subunit type 1 TsaE [Ignavibacteria bacterium]
MERIVTSVSTDYTEEAGHVYASTLDPGIVTGLFGNLGSGKTQFVKGVCRYYDVKEIVNSPTFIIKNEYTGNDPVSGNEIYIHHFDLYRISNINELTELGLNDIDVQNTIVIIEWAELAEEYFRGNINKIFFDYGIKENERIIKFT